MEAVDVIMRILHVGSAIALLGGMVFALTVAIPAARQAAGEQAQELIGLMAKRSNRITHPSIVFLVVSGGYQWMRMHDVYEPITEANGPLIPILLGTKVLIALVAFTLAFAAAFGVLRGCPSKWIKINLFLATSVVVLAAVVRMLRLTGG